MYCIMNPPQNQQHSFKEEKMGMLLSRADGFRKDGKISYVQRVPGGKVFLSKEELRQFRAMYTRPVPRASTAFAPAFRGEVPERGCR